MKKDTSEDMEKEEHASVATGIASRYNHPGNKSSSSSENWKLIRVCNSSFREFTILYYPLQTFNMHMIHIHT